ncbi:MAG: 6-carboxytetrahydropterin synthase [Elusimicrobiales bacterium]|jgi:6-pyruvoyltetrahydropterin/6-carboxytetrahydropterin synthase|nr:6-carboxytetrahydropterin synthase [Elusimicrobiales bacterium]
MKIFSVKKIFEIAYAHRLLNYNGKCENLHGHNGKIEIMVVSEVLNNQDMVMDFTYINSVVKKWLDENLDHRVILHKNDPLVKPLGEHSQKLFLTPSNPTAEIIAGVIKEEIKKLGIDVNSVKFWETDTSVAEVKE